MKLSYMALIFMEQEISGQPPYVPQSTKGVSERSWTKTSEKRPKTCRDVIGFYQIWIAKGDAYRQVFYTGHDGPNEWFFKSHLEDPELIPAPEPDLWVEIEFPTEQYNAITGETK